MCLRMKISERFRQWDAGVVSKLTTESRLNWMTNAPRNLQRPTSRYFLSTEIFRSLPIVCISFFEDLKRVSVHKVSLQSSISLNRMDSEDFQPVPVDCRELSFRYFHLLQSFCSPQIDYIAIFVHTLRSRRSISLELKISQSFMSNRWTSESNLLDIFVNYDLIIEQTKRFALESNNFYQKLRGKGKDG